MKYKEFSLRDKELNSTDFGAFRREMTLNSLVQEHGNMDTAIEAYRIAHAPAPKGPGEAQIIENIIQRTFLRLRSAVQRWRAERDQNNSFV